MFSKWTNAILTAVLVIASGTSQADDIEIYYGGAAVAGSEPMVMLSLDYRPNLGSAACTGNECDFLITEGYLSPTGPYTFFDLLRAALRKVMDPLEDVRVGLMINHDNKNNCGGPGQVGCSNGGYIGRGFQPFFVGDTNNAKAQYHDFLANIPTPAGNLSHSYQGKELFFEFFRYLTGQGIYNGHNGYTDFGSDSSQNLDQDFPAIAWDKSIETGNKLSYVTPLDSGQQCTRLFSVNIMFFVSNQEDDSDDAISAGFGGPKNSFPDVIEYLNDVDLANGQFGTAPDISGNQNVTSYFIVDPTMINKTTIGYAQAGNTGQPLPLSTDPMELVATLQDVFKQILSVSTTFVAASIPVNVFNRAEVVDNIYLGLFQANTDGKPYWVGNVKKLKLSGLNDPGGNVQLVDALDNTAIAADGRIRSEALTFWTSAGDLPPPDLQAGEVAGRDGRSVGRGGAGQQIPGFTTGGPGLNNSSFGGRELYFDDSGQLEPLNVDPATIARVKATLGLADDTEVAEMLAYARGMDIDDLDGDGDTDEARDWILADPLHSRPLPINYGAINGHSETNPAIFLAVASNDGYLHFIRNTATDGSESGEEAWAFMPHAVIDKLGALRLNVPAGLHPYAVDGSPVAYIEDQNHDGNIDPGDHVYLYVGLRRGGKAYYALDISDPSQPELLWTIDKSGDFAELGMTFSTPRVGLVDVGSGPQPVLVFGGGYDVNKDLRTGVGTNDTEGQAIYVVDAETGQLIWKAVGQGTSSSDTFLHPDLVDSIPSTVSAVDTNGDSLLDRILVGDTGGNVWRADLTGTSTSNWKLTRVARLGRHATGASGVLDDRRFFHRPDVVLSKDDDGAFDAIVIGSGDRADPKDKGGTVENFAYMIKDRNIGIGSGVDSPLVDSDLDDVTDNCLQAGSCSLDLLNGWRLGLEDSGEKSLATPLTIGGTVYFTTYLPFGSAATSGQCAPAEGNGRLYAVNLQNAFASNNYNTADDDPLNPGEPTTQEDRSTDLNSQGIPAEVVSIPPNRILRPDLTIEETEFSTRWRTFWYEASDVQP
jgi:type IV pilus assembly protein PilY1